MTNKLEEYNAKKVEVEASLSNLNTQKILNDQKIKEQQELFQTQFGTTDPVELAKILDGYKAEVVTKEAELSALEAQVV
jgi:hypothetical protein